MNKEWAVNSFKQ